MKNRPPALAVLAALLFAAGALSARAAAAEAEVPPASPGILVSSPESRLELRVPAAYWEALTAKVIAQNMQGGCGAAQVPPDLVMVLQHRDAPAQIIITRSERPFLMRDKNDLETFEKGFMQAVQGQVGGQVSEVESGYEERDGMILHRFALTATPSAGGGCAMPQSAGPPQKLRFEFVDYFLRPQGEDALFFRAGCRSFAETYQKVAPEIDLVLSSMHFTGKLAEQFFDAAAPVEKVPTAKQAAKSLGGGRSPLPSIMLAAGLVLAIWLIWRKRKQPQI